jgi:hypothetical protein
VRLVFGPKAHRLMWFRDMGSGILTQRTCSLITNEVPDLGTVSIGNSSLCSVLMIDYMVGSCVYLGYG